MKRIFSILAAVIILVSGMHMSIATHLCGGEISQVKFSVLNEIADCGMCSEPSTEPLGINNVDCCQNELRYLVVDNNYNTSTFEINKPVLKIIQLFIVPTIKGIQFAYQNSTLNTNVQPPGKFIATAVNITDICVFRI